MVGWERDSATRGLGGSGEGDDRVYGIGNSVEDGDKSVGERCKLGIYVTERG
jgi:hypothetical protein